jgi:uncharacterized protein YqgV (UPF0045/DUF77 family)
MRRDLLRRQSDERLHAAAAALEPAIPDDPRDYRTPMPAQTAIEQATREAVMRALAEADQHASDARIVVVNVNIQVASGGGATNQIGSQPSANNHWGRDR